jgi:aspartate kinase
VALVVQKFGGTSVADPDRIREVADHVARTPATAPTSSRVSAMGKETDELLRLAARSPHAGPAGRWTC